MGAQVVGTSLPRAWSTRPAQGKGRGSSSRHLGWLVHRDQRGLASRWGREGKVSPCILGFSKETSWRIVNMYTCLSAHLWCNVVDVLKANSLKAASVTNAPPGHDLSRCPVCTPSEGQPAPWLCDPACPAENPRRRRACRAQGWVWGSTAA